MNSGVQEGEVKDRAAGEVEKYQFESFELFPKQKALWYRGERLPLMPKPIETLVILLEHAGHTVSKDDLLAQVWKGVAVEENNLTQSISTLRKALGEKRGENRFIVTEPGHGYRFVAPVARIVEPVEIVTPPAPSTPVRRRWVVGMVVAILLAGISSVAWLTRRPSAGTSPRRSVAVLRIRDLSKTSTESWLQTALTEMLTSELAEGGKLRTIPTEDVERWRSDAGPALEHDRQAELFRSAQQNLGADALVVGAYLVTGSCPNCQVRVDLGLMNAGTGDRIGTVIEEGSGADLTDLATRLGRRLRTEFGLPPQIQSTPRWPAASAMREYAEGLKSLRSGDPMAARDHLQVAAGADPGNALIRCALGETWTALGYAGRANDENRRAFEMSSALDRLDRLGVEARYRDGLQQWDRAIEIYKSIFQLFPDSLDDGLKLARAQWRAGRTADVKSTLSILRMLPRPTGNDPRIDMLEAQMVGGMNDYPRTRDLAHRAAEEARSRGALYIYARARLLEGGAMQNLADFRDASAARAAAVQDEARHVCEQIGDRECISKAWRIAGNRFFSLGDFQQAQQAYAEGVTIARELGNHAELANLLTGFGVVEQTERQWDEAEKHFQEAIALKVETGFHADEIQTLLAEMYIALGRFDDASRTLESAYAVAHDASAHEDLGEIFRLQSMLARSVGQLDRAQQLSSQALAELRSTQNHFVLTTALANASSLATLRGDLKAAENDLAAITARTAENEGVVQLARAELWAAQGRFQDAATEAVRSAKSLDQVRADAASARALLVAADALEMLHRENEALQTCRDAEVRARRSLNPVPIALTRVCQWRLSSSGDAMPTALPVTDPEVALVLDYSAAMRARRSHAGNAGALFDQFAHLASERGYVSWSKRADSLR